MTHDYDQLQKPYASDYQMKLVLKAIEFLQELVSFPQ